MPDLAIAGICAGYVMFLLLGIALGRAAARGDARAAALHRELAEDRKERERV